MQKKFIYIGVTVLVVGGLLVWLFIESSKPLPGQKEPYDCSNYIDFSKLTDLTNSDKCRVHVPLGTEVKDPTNPPTHGPHYADWVRAGVYTDPKDDRNMIHSLEHGYVIMHYRCNLVTSDKSQESSGSATPSGKLDTQAECDQRKAQLEAIYEKKGKRKLIVVARPNLDTNFALTAWTYLDKFDNFDQARVEKFIDAHRDNGPERTME